MTSKQTPSPLTPEWSRKIDTGTLNSGPFTRTIEANEAECRDLARRIGVKTIEAMQAEVTLQPVKGTPTIHVWGRVTAKVTLVCVITAEDIVQMIDEPFESWYADKDAAISLTRARHDRLSQQVNAEVPMLEERDDPEPIINGHIDIGELAAQFLSLAVDPYAHSESAKVALERQPVEDEGTAEESRNPFAALKKWKEGRRRPEN